MSRELDAAMAQVTKMYGAGAVLRMGESPFLDIKVIPTGLAGLDDALGIGGVPVGRIIEIFGREGVGKTTLGLHLMAAAQRDPSAGAVLYVDAEHALDVGYAATIGVDVGKMLVSQPDNGEQALEIVDICVRSGAMSLIVVDSVAALTPRSEIEGEMGDASGGLQARLMSQAMRKLTGAAARNGTTVVFINQVRDKIGMTFGNPETTPGGQALKFYSSARISLHKRGLTKVGDGVVGQLVELRVVKNKFAPPFRTTTLPLMFNKGFVDAEVTDA